MRVSSTNGQVMRGHLAYFMRRPQGMIAAYLLAQAILISAWWLLLLRYPASIAWFQPSTWPEATLQVYWLADLALLVIGSATVAYGVARTKSWARTALWCLAAASCYPTLVCLATSTATDQAWIATALMASMTSVLLVVATIHGIGPHGPAPIRVISLPPRVAFQWTVFQAAIFWCFFLWIVPRAIVELESHFGRTAWQHFGQTFAAAVLFVAASGLGVWSAWTMAMMGRGTPLPTATAPRLVVSGPYAWVRNPMALAGISQGVAVGWLMGSELVILYALAGAILWHFTARPVEECDLVERFGAAYESYRRRVPLWLPKHYRWWTRPQERVIKQSSASVQR